jgi:hypothetical protein
MAATRKTTFEEFNYSNNNATAKARAATENESQHLCLRGFDRVAQAHMYDYTRELCDSNYWSAVAHSYLRFPMF